MRNRATSAGRERGQASMTDPHADHEKPMIPWPYHILGEIGWFLNHFWD